MSEAGWENFKIKYNVSVYGDEGICLINKLLIVWSNDAALWHKAMQCTQTVSLGCIQCWFVSVCEIYLKRLLTFKYFLIMQPTLLSLTPNLSLSAILYVFASESIKTKFGF